MTIAVAHHLTSISDNVIAVAATEAAAHGTKMVVLHVVTSTDLDRSQALSTGISDIVTRVVDEAKLAESPEWEVGIIAATSSGVDEISAALLNAAAEAAASILVIGARRRSPVGKAFLGSVTQEIVLHADIPVLVVKSAPVIGRDGQA